MIKKFIHKYNLNYISNFYYKNQNVASFPRYKLSDNSINENKVIGWVPYIKNNTEIVIFNFFSLNYSIRKPIKGSIYLIKNKNILDKYKFILNQDEMKEFDCKKIFENTAGSSVIVELQSSLIRKSHGGHDGHLRFWGKYKDKENNYTSITHSMPISHNDLFFMKEFHSRNYNVGGEELCKINFYPGGKVENNKDEKAYYGFNMILNKENVPHSCWHLSPKNLSTKPKQKYLQGFYCPEINKIDPYVIIDNQETGVNQNTVHCYIYQNGQIKDSAAIEFNGNFVKKVSDIFKKKINGPYLFFIIFDSKPVGHAHVHYHIDDKLADQVHMHECNWEINDNKLTPIKVNYNKNCRKFFFVNNQENYENHIMLHVDKVSNKDFSNLKIRCLNKEKEIVKNLQILNDEPIKIIDLKNINNDQLNSNYVVQIESYDYNFSASLMSFCREKKLLAIDHFTGG